MMSRVSIFLGYKLLYISLSILRYGKRLQKSKNRGIIPDRGLIWKEIKRTGAE